MIMACVSKFQNITFIYPMVVTQAKYLWKTWSMEKQKYLVCCYLILISAFVVILKYCNTRLDKYSNIILCFISHRPQMNGTCGNIHTIRTSILNYYFKFLVSGTTVFTIFQELKFGITIRKWRWRVKPWMNNLSFFFFLFFFSVT